MPPDPAAEEIVVFQIVRDSRCSECGAELWKGSLLRMENDHPLCMECAGLGRLEYLPRGDTALTRRARKHSPLCAVVVRFSRSRGRCERQGLLVDAAALEQAERECLDDADQRERSRARAAERRLGVESRYVDEFAGRVLELYPACPKEEAHGIAEHACVVGSGRVGRTSDARGFEPAAIDAAVVAHVRHLTPITNGFSATGTTGGKPGRGCATASTRSCAGGERPDPTRQLLPSILPSLAERPGRSGHRLARVTAPRGPADRPREVPRPATCVFGREPIAEPPPTE